MGMKRLPDRDMLIPAAGGVSIRCRCYGAGPALVLLHGNGEDYRCFEKQIIPFSRRFRLVAIDSRGHGGSGMGEPFSLRAMADDVETVLDALKIKKASLVGFSDGGNAALYFALRHPDRLEKLVLAGANLFPGGLEKRTQRQDRVIWNLLRLLGKVSAEARRKARIFGLMVREPNIDPRALSTIKAPCLVLAGEQDVIRESHTKLIARAIPGSKLLIIPGCDHFVFKNGVHQVNEAILQFLQ